MNWVILLIIIFITVLLVLATCGVGGGMMLLVILNGYMSAPPLIMIIFVVSALGTSVLFSTLFGWLAMKIRNAENIRLWHIISSSVGMNGLLIVIAFGVFFVMQLVS